MKNFLEEIIRLKELEVETLKNQYKDYEFPERKRAFHSFIEELKNNDAFKVISEIKKASPSKGDLNTELNPKLRALEYVEAGADCISVLTERHFFKGKEQDIVDVGEAVDIPLLRKDFIIDSVQLQESLSLGADLVLLIAAINSKEKLKELYDEALKLGLEPLVEIHDEDDLEKILELKPKLIGINNRNLKSFEVDINTTITLKTKMNFAESYVISESGFDCIEKINMVKSHGIRGVLVGEAFVTSNKFKELLACFKRGGD
ncbi:indole-3-glycerol phosphate synthase TrpC [Clostridium sp. YIM B02505]|uniref:indole-3-glycerol-phosphate synthase n=1 Tax=Clostridium yunnanense TaxID=2800325 RepID=A0ABS1EI88_9CLOT|nr:indole-3-glycerol phosphate synthase TrpC [Clostridium yunnanense]MBK1809082.1 indole-3-glycerol phosphate synthase TrpC [Clostridium yunnanense]